MSDSSCPSIGITIGITIDLSESASAELQGLSSAMGGLLRTNYRHTRARVDCTDTQDSSAALLLSQPCCAMVLLAFKRTTYKLERGHDEARRRRR